MLTRAGWQRLDVAIAAGKIAGLSRSLHGDVEFDAGGLYVAPGFVDVHVHGAGGSEDPEHMAAFLPSTGVTAFVPTLASAPPDATLGFVRNVARLQPAGAEVLGSHLEGPWISSDHLGAHLGSAIRMPDLEEAMRLVEAGQGTLRRVTLAPELPGAQQLIQLLPQAGVQVSLGHSGCSIQQAQEAAGRGATSVTHVYNAMAPFHHREPGLVGAALSSDRLFCELIADGAHVHSAAVLALVRARSHQSVALVSDGLPPLGLAAGRYEWQELAIESDGVACWAGDGRLVGSASSMLAGVRNLVSWGVGLDAACSMAATTGAMLAGAQDRKGRIAKGYDADLVLLDSDLTLVQTYCRGARAAELPQT